MGGGTPPGGGRLGRSTMSKEARGGRLTVDGVGYDVGRELLNPDLSLTRRSQPSLGHFRSDPSQELFNVGFNLLIGAAAALPYCRHAS